MFKLLAMANYSASPPLSRVPFSGPSLQTEQPRPCASVVRRTHTHTRSPRGAAGLLLAHSAQARQA